MKQTPKSKDEQIGKLKEKLREAEANLEAIRSGAADAIVVNTKDGVKVFTIQGAEAAYKIMVETMNEGALTLDSDGVILYVNSRFSSMIGFDSSELVGKLIYNFIPQNQVKGFESFFGKSVKGRKIYQDFELVKRDSSILPVYFSSAPLDVVGRNDVCIVASDLSERYKAKRKLLELNNSLEKKVRERTDELEKRKNELEKSQQQLEKFAASLEDQVEHRTKQVRELTKALSLAEQKQRQRFSLILHEDLQQVLFSIKARFVLLKDSIKEGDSKEIEEDIEELERLSTKAISTTKRLAIEFSPPVLQKEGLDAALKWLAFHMERQYGLKVYVCIEEKFRIIREDERVLLVLLVQELLLNVVKHAKTKNANLIVSRDDKHINICVEDKGAGFDLKQEKNFARKKAHFGLFSIEERLRLFGGSLDITSSPGMGTRISMKLPFDSRFQQLSVE